jgi:hypothetical protein
MLILSDHSLISQVKVAMAPTSKSSSVQGGKGPMKRLAKKSNGVAASVGRFAAASVGRFAAGSVGRFASAVGSPVGPCTSVAGVSFDIL